MDRLTPNISALIGHVWFVVPAILVPKTLLSSTGIYVSYTTKPIVLTLTLLVGQIDSTLHNVFIWSVNVATYTYLPQLSLRYHFITLSFAIFAHNVIFTIWNPLCLFRDWRSCLEEKIKIWIKPHFWVLMESIMVGWSEGWFELICVLNVTGNITFILLFIAFSVGLKSCHVTALVMSVFIRYTTPTSYSERTLNNHHGVNTSYLNALGCQMSAILYSTAFMSSWNYSNDQRCELCFRNYFFLENLLVLACFIYGNRPIYS